MPGSHAGDAAAPGEATADCDCQDVAVVEAAIDVDSDRDGEAEGDGDANGAAPLMATLADGVTWALADTDADDDGLSAALDVINADAVRRSAELEKETVAERVGVADGPGADDDADGDSDLEALPDGDGDGDDGVGDGGAAELVAADVTQMARITAFMSATYKTPFHSATACGDKNLAAVPTALT